MPTEFCRLCSFSRVEIRVQRVQTEQHDRKRGCEGITTISLLSLNFARRFSPESSVPRIARLVYSAPEGAFVEVAKLFFLLPAQFPPLQSTRPLHALTTHQYLTNQLRAFKQHRQHQETARVRQEEMAEFSRLVVPKPPRTTTESQQKKESVYWKSFKVITSPPLLLLVE